MKLEIIKDDDDWIILDGTGNVLARGECSRYRSHIPYELEKAIIKAFGIEDDEEDGE